MKVVVLFALLLCCSSLKSEDILFQTENYLLKEENIEKKKKFVLESINKCDETVHQQHQSLEDLKVENLNLKKKMVAKKKSISKLNNELNSVNALIDKFFQ
jgi:predicted RNase H-like nuclease (RuvC/YqgF family)